MPSEVHEAKQIKIDLSRYTPKADAPVNRWSDLLGQCLAMAEFDPKDKKLVGMMLGAMMRKAPKREDGTRNLLAIEKVLNEARREGRVPAAFFKVLMGLSKKKV